MTFLLDTNVISELRKPAADPRVVAWVDARPTSELFVSAMTLYELERGILARERKDPAQGAHLRAWFTGQVLPEFAGRVLPVDGEVARRAAALSVPDARPYTDGLIAATALVHAKTVVTRNIQDFPGVAVVDPWAA
ncbi:PIN domain-containing protein [Cellulomonas hominis]|uniref:PIN domain-containing protein n=1 Tax=Cellulomonas hominis TaxID=156981 RepID=UPI0014446182|nr:type II toxin-antitoxin system VapC family toxin [Cellulomonas hominis]